MFTVQELQDAAALVHRQMPPSPQYDWPLLSREVGAEVWVKHENHNLTGAFKVRGGVTFMDWVRREYPKSRGICTATRGNHGQSQARAATAAGLLAKIYVPFGNSVEKNAAMRAYGGEVIEFGSDFDVAKDEARRVAIEEDLVFVPPFHRELVRGVATYALEFFTAATDLHTVYVPIGCGSGICGVIAARDALGLATRVVGVVPEQADCVKRSVEAGQLIETNSARTFADGTAVRIPVQDAYDIYAKGADRIISLREDEIAAAMRLYYRTTHNIAEGAGAEALAALWQERDAMAGRKVGVILSGGNVDTDIYSTVLSGQTPQM
ncbi:MAG: threonine dehydratase [Paracoccaceae bacterium]|nr:threonine dehydratase [Marinibacterium sp.]